MSADHNTIKCTRQTNEWKQGTSIHREDWRLSLCSVPDQYLPPLGILSERYFSSCSKLFIYSCTMRSPRHPWNGIMWLLSVNDIPNAFLLFEKQMVSKFIAIKFWWNKVLTLKVSKYTGTIRGRDMALQFPLVASSHTLFSFIALVHKWVSLFAMGRSYLVPFVCSGSYLGPFRCSGSYLGPIGCSGSYLGPFDRSGPYLGNFGSSGKYLGPYGYSGLYLVPFGCSGS